MQARRSIAPLSRGCESGKCLRSLNRRREGTIISRERQQFKGLWREAAQRRDGARRSAERHRRGKTDRREVTLFDSTGLAIQDLAIARVAHAKTGEPGLATIDL
jgi:ornithine cyclodeaminase/alanine dehydrogenase-like protein (mu-crystallin family)